MRILFINQTLGIGGAEVFNNGLLRWLKSQGHEINAFTNNRAFCKTLTDFRIQTEIVPIVVDIIGDWKGLVKALFLWPFLLTAYLEFLIKHRRCDVLFMTGYVEKILCTPIAKLLSMRVVWLEFAPTAVFSKFLGLPSVFYQLVKPLPDMVIVPTQNTQKYHKFQKYLIIPLARERSLVKSKSTVTAALVVCVSRLQIGKGQDLLLKAWARVVKKVPKARLKIIGGGDDKYRSYLATIAPRSVEFMGNLDNLMALNEVAKCQVFAFPSVWDMEGFGVSIIEAMALGKPVVGFNAGPVPEIVDHGRTGLLARAGDVNEYANQLIKLLSNPRLGKELGTAGRDKYLANYTFDGVGPLYEQAFT